MTKEEFDKRFNELLDVFYESIEKTRLTTDPDRSNQGPMFDQEGIVQQTAFDLEELYREYGKNFDHDFTIGQIAQLYERLAYKVKFTSRYKIDARYSLPLYEKSLLYWEKSSRTPIGKSDIYVGMADAYDCIGDNEHFSQYMTMAKDWVIEKYGKDSKELHKFENENSWLLSRQKSYLKNK